MKSQQKKIELVTRPGLSILILWTDYDGTLAPIASHPDLAVIPSETKSVLERLARHHDVHISIISGRSVQSVKKMVGIEGKEYTQPQL